PVLAFRVRPTGRGQGTTDLHRIPADAAGRELQPRGRESGTVEKDATGGGGGQRHRPIKASVIVTAGGAHGPSAFSQSVDRPLNGERRPAVVVRRSFSISFGTSENGARPVEYLNVGLKSHSHVLWSQREFAILHVRKQNQNYKKD